MAKKRTAWKNLKIEGAPATKVPSLLKVFAAEADDEQLVGKYHDLRWKLRAVGRWHSAAGRAVDELLGMVAKGSVTGKAGMLALSLVADVVGADNFRFWAHGPAELDEHGRAARLAVVEQRTLLSKLLEDDDTAVAAHACVVAAVVPELEQDLMPTLQQLAKEGATTGLRASALLALACAIDDAVASTIEACRNDEEPPVRGAATLAWLRRHPERGPSEVQDGLDAWMDWRHELFELAWFHLPRWYEVNDISPGVGRALHALALSRGEDGPATILQWAIAAGASATVPAREHLSRLVLALGGFASDVPAKIVPAETLSESQRGLALALADSPLVAAGHCGIAPCGSVRRRWLGLDPAGPLEACIEVDIAGKGRVSEPRWRVFQQSRAPEHLAAMSGADRYRALALWAAGLYRATIRLSDEEVLAEIAQVDESEILDVATEVIEDVLQTAKHATLGRLPPTPSASLLMFVPFMRAGKALDSAWDRLVWLGLRPLALQVLEAQPLDRREQIVLQYLDPANRGAWRLHGAMAALALAPTKTVGDHARALIATFDFALTRQQLEGDLAKLVAEHPGLS